MPRLVAAAAALLFAAAPSFAQGEPPENQVAKDRTRWDQAKDQQGAPDGRVYPDVDEDSLKRANDDVLALRKKVWEGELAPGQFYSSIQDAYARRFGPDYAAKVKVFLDAMAKAAPKSGQTVDFARMTDAQRAEFFRLMPKGAELHLHLTGAIPGDKLLEIGEQLGVKLPVDGILKVMRLADLAAYGVPADKKELAVADLPAKLRSDLAASLVTKDGETFPQFLDKWKVIGPITNNEKAQYLMMKYLAEYAKAQNIVYLELLVSGNPPEAQEWAVAAAKKVEKETGVTLRLLAYDGWYSSMEQDEAAIAKARQLYPEVVGFNMVADERMPPLDHYEAFKPLREKLARLQVTLHAGEQAGTASNIVNDLLLNPKRYGHATHVEEDPLAEAVLYENKIPVEVSLISNEKTLVQTDLSKHPEPKLLAWGVPIVPDTDDPGVFGSTLSDEYRLSQSQFGLSWDQLKEMSRNGVRSSFVDDATKARLLKDLDRRIDKFEKSSDFRRFKIAPSALQAPEPVELHLEK